MPMPSRRALLRVFIPALVTTLLLVQGVPHISSAGNAGPDPSVARVMIPDRDILPEIPSRVSGVLPAGATVASASPSTANRPHLTLEQTENILVLGMDYRPGGQMWRTDSIMIVAVDQIERKAGVVSIPRDLWVEIPGYGEGRINIADFYGEERGGPGAGPVLVGQILQENFGITTHHWVRIQQEGLVGLVDTLGGVTVTLDCPLFEKTPHPTLPGEYEYLQLPAGENHLDGITAKKFATFRYASTDFSRARRQQQLIWSIRQRASELDLLPMVPQLWGELATTFQTDLSLLDVFRLVALGTELKPDDVRGITLPRDALAGKLVQGGSQVLVVNDRAVLQEALDGLFAARPLADLGRSLTGQCQ